MKKIILASNSPRRRELLAGLDVDFEVRVLPDIAEDYPESYPVLQTAEYIAQEKAAAYKDKIGSDELILTADTVVIVGDRILGKPQDKAEAVQMLRLISGKTHIVATGVCMFAAEKERHFSVQTEVTFKELSDEEINYYIEKYQPFDKAGAYGIQEWIGYVGVTALKGSYFNVMGLPVQRIWEELKQF